ncbi:PAS domain-containing methyl-accepting chemotaxis protein [Allorhizobium sp. BGMRC 0089]|uniref:methyl-accepting chemotaxis protein n=1 Tax=Allorhizobium sonneratiae TaxID=2934936 RepID=UPI00203420FC|nr:PAS domain-containing methyl-accepting chemotaxis protein [Allorhizobium sonneratiae]MCM2291363.1 PAS domain-containing methyl-accepting chemotaxis protein [Allorhizobium sonneratiae]
MLGLSSKSRNAKLEALETVTANVMIADADLNITYMNSAVRDLLKEAEGDLRKELPRFDVSKLVGSNIDIFHKDPSHQRNMLAKLQKQHKATIWVGQRVFDLIVTPLKDGGKVTGFVVEWANARERLQNLDFQYQMEAISRVQAIIEFKPDGTIVNANENFLKALGYTLDEIRGKSHSIFVDPAYAKSQDYQMFWDNLRSGKFQADEFTRIGKNGKVVVINASYNPILDASGKVTKVVKFATDVTDRVNATREIGQALTRVAAGDLSFRLDQAFHKDFEALRRDMNEALKQLNATLSGVSVSMQQISAGTQDISSSAQDLSKRTEQQAATLEETAAALDEITSNVANASKRAEEARTAAELANNNAVHSGKVVANAVEAMSRIEQSSSQISNIIGVIDEIAFQTNLLALNAGVEAARAGEAGKGFAVVAQEVRELAQRSAKAAKEIKDLIRNSSTEVENGVRLVSETGEALKTIESNIITVNEQIQAIASAAREQSIGLSEVNTAINQMDQVTQQNAAMVEESNASIATLVNEVDKLHELIGRFQLSGQASASTGQGRHYQMKAA